jgi:hypothetical protein
MPTLVGVVHSMVAVKSTVIVLAIDLTWWIRSSIGVPSVVGGHARVGLLVGVALVRIFEVTRLIGKKVAIVVS